MDREVKIAVVNGTNRMIPTTQPTNGTRMTLLPINGINRIRKMSLMMDGLIKTTRSGKTIKATKTTGIIKMSIRTIRRIARRMLWTLARMFKRIAKRMARRIRSGTVKAKKTIRSGTVKAKRTIRKSHIDHHLNLLFM
jgi:hypothetical protein